MDLTLERVTVSFEQRPALVDVSLRIAQGSHVGICGAAASGKTTLLKVLAGLVRPEGHVSWNGDEVWALSAEERRSRQAAFGMVFQTDALFDSSTVLENVLVPLVRRGLGKREAEARAWEAIDSVGLSGSGHLLPDQLSGGMRKRAGIARAVAARPRILLADDPLAGLDPATSAQIAQLLLDASRGRTLVFACPDPVPQLRPERWLLLEGGRVAYDGPFDALALERS